MNLKNRLFHSVVACAALALLTCTSQQNPFKPQDARINLVVENSSHQIDTITVTDTVGNQVRIGMSAYLPSYISLVKVTVTGGPTETDTTVAFSNASTWTDTQWVDITFHSTGTKTVTVTVSLQGAPDKTFTATITIVGKNVNHKPTLSVSGVRNIVSAQACSLSLSATDPDSGQTLTFAMIKGPQNATLTGTVFRWTSPATFTGVDSAIFMVTDNGTPAMSDTQKVMITVSSQIIAPAQVLGVKAVSNVNGYFVLSWNKVSSADSYNIFRSADTAAANFQKIGSTSDSLFGDSVKSGNFYYYVVAVNTAGPSPASAIVYSGSIKTPPVIMVPTLDTSVSQGKTLSFIVTIVASAQDTVLLGATDISGAKLPDSATFTPKTGLFTWTPTFGELGLYKIIFTATDGNMVVKDTVKITVIKTDRPPVVQAQSINTGVNQAIAVTLVASDPDNDSITQWQVTQKPHNGTATLADSTKGSVAYTPNSGFTGVDTFAIKAFDGTLWSQAPANVIVTVSSIKVAPKIQTQPRSDTTVSQGGSVTFTVAINNASPSPTFIWYQGTKGSGTMKDSSTNPLYQKTGVTAADSGNYYVVVVNSSGADTSAYAHLAVVVPPAAPVLVAPANGASGQPVSTTLVWNKVAGASLYMVQVASDSGFSTIIASDSTVTDTTKAVSSLAKGTTYYWRVNAKGATGTGAWSSTRKLTTIVQFSLSVTATNGTVAQTPSAMAYDSGTVVGLKAAPSTGYQFVNWTGDATGSTDSTTVVMNGAKNITANFSIIKYSLTVTAGTGGTITVPATSPVTVNYGAATTITAAPSAGYAFVNWTVTGTATIANASSATTTITLSSGNAAVTANFMSTTNTLAVVAGTGGTITAPATSPVTVTYGVPTTITAVPSAGYTFVNWTVTSGTGAAIANANSASTTVTVSSGSAAVTANFTPITYQLTAIAGTGGTIRAPASSPTTVNYGAATAITASANTGYTFANWTVTGTGATVANANNVSTTVTLAGGNATVTANFAKITYTLSVTPGTGGTATPTTPTTVNYGDATTITATPSAGYSFVNWTVTAGTGATIASSTSASTTVALTAGNATVTANFAKITYTLTVTPGTGGTATPTTPTTVNYGDATAITASPSTGYKFVNWTVTAGTGATIASPTSASTTVALTGGNATVTANFQALTCSWTGVDDFSITHNTPFSIATCGDTVDVGLQKSGVSQSTDNGTTWPPNGGAFGPPSFYVIALSQYGNLTLAGTDGLTTPPGGIYSSTDNGTGGNFWTSDTFSSPTSVYTFYKNGTTIYAGTSFGLLFSSDSGKTWTTDQAASTLTGSVSAIMVVGTGIYATSNGTLYYRLLSGYSWSTVAGAPSGIISLFNCGGTMFAGTSSGIYMHDNSTGNWTAAANSGLATGVVSYSVSGNEIFAAGNGVSVSIDNGDHWTAVNGGLPSGSSTYAPRIASNSNSVFIISGQAVYKSPLP